MAIFLCFRWLGKYEKFSELSRLRNKYFVLSEAVSSTPALESGFFSHLRMFFATEHLPWSWNNSRGVTAPLLCSSRGGSCAPAGAPAVAPCCRGRGMLTEPGARVTLQLWPLPSTNQGSSPQSHTRCNTVKLLFTDRANM